MKSVENLLKDGFASVELEERLEMVHLAAMTESADVSITSDIEKPAPSEDEIGIE